MKPLDAMDIKIEEHRQEVARLNRSKEEFLMLQELGESAEGKRYISMLKNLLNDHRNAAEDLDPEDAIQVAKFQQKITDFKGMIGLIEHSETHISDLEVKVHAVNERINSLVSEKGNSKGANPFLTEQQQKELEKDND